MQQTAGIGKTSADATPDGRLDSTAPTEGVLYLSTVGDGFDPGRDVAFGPHCFLGRQNAVSSWWDFAFVDPFPDNQASASTQKDIGVLIEGLLPGLVDRLNARHGTTHSAAFWRLIVLPWLIELAQRAWLSYATLREIKNRTAGRPLRVEVLKAPPRARFVDTGQFFNALLRDVDFNWWIDSEVAAVLAPSSWTLLPSKPTSPAPTATERPPAPAPDSVLRQAMRTMKYCLGYSDIVGIRWSGLLLAVYANLLPKTPIRMPAGPPTRVRGETAFPEDFLDLLARLIDITMPDSMLDGFANLAARARRLPYRAGRLRLGTLDLWNDREKVIAAFAREAREKLVICQHGGMYGVFRYNLLVHEVELRSNIFLSWGWTLDEDTGGHIVPLPSPFLSKLANRHKRRNGSLIVVGNPVRLRLSRIMDGGPRWAGWLRYCEHTLDFLRGLSDDIRDAVIFRPYVKTASDIDIGEVVSRQYPKMPMLVGDLHAAMMSCRLLVIGNCSTTLNIALAANVPTVVYWRDEFLNPRPQAAPYFEALKRAGILFSDAQEAARHVNRIWPDVEAWWSGADVQDARRAWAHQYARTDWLWWWQWMKALARLRTVG